MLKQQCYTRINVKLTCQDALHASRKRAVISEISNFRQTDSLDGVGQRCRRFELEQGDVERLLGLARLFVVGVNENGFDRNLLLAGFTRVVAIVLTYRHLFEHQSNAH